MHSDIKELVFLTSTERVLSGVSKALCPAHTRDLDLVLQR